MFKSKFSHIEYIRDSLSHIEERSLGLDQNKNEIKSNLLILDSYNGNKYQYTGNDGNIYDIEISEKTIEIINDILHKIINAYKWI